MRLPDLLTRLGDPDESADGWLAVCPAHNDSKPSLRVAVSDAGKVLLRCRAGCETADVLAALSLSFADLMAMDASGVHVKRAASTDSPAGIADVAALKVRLDAWALNLAESSHSDASLAYAAQRFGLGMEDAARLGLGHATDLPGGPRLVVPFRDRAGVARGFQARALAPDASVRWLGPKSPDGASWARIGWFPGAADWTEVIVCEGPGDALTACAAGYDTIAVRGAGLVSNPAVVAQIAEMVAGRVAIIAGDGDTAGERFSTMLAESLASKGVTALRLVLAPGMDLTSWREADPGAFTGEFVRAVIKAEAPPSAVTGVSAPPATPARHEWTELGNARRVHARLGGLVRHSPALGWLLWDGSAWVTDTRGEVRSVIQESAEDLMIEAPTTNDPQKAARWAWSSQQGSNIDHTEKQLKSLRGVAVAASDIDAHPDLLPCANGTVDLRTGEIKAADPADLMTQALNVQYRPDASAPRWRQFLDEVFPGQPEMPAYMQRLVGYGITGHATEQCFVLLYGAGSNGKSVFTSALYNVFRPLTANVGIETFLHTGAGDGAAPSPDIAALRAARLVLTSESEHGARLAEARLKRLTGGDPVTARHLHREPFTFMPAFLMFLSTNGLPEIRGQDDGIWRRIKVIEWLAKFDGSSIDKGLTAKLAAESEGILAWAVEGSRLWYAHGLGEPPSVAAKVAGYREESDKLSGFYPGMYRADPEGFIGRGDLYAEYSDWAKGDGATDSQLWRNTTLFSALISQGVAPVKRRGERGFRLRRATAEEQSSTESEIGGAGGTSNHGFPIWLLEKNSESIGENQESTCPLPPGPAGDPTPAEPPAEVVSASDPPAPNYTSTHPLPTAGPSLDDVL